MGNAMKTESPDRMELSGLFNGNYVTLNMQGASALPVAAAVTTAIVTAAVATAKKKKSVLTVKHHAKSCSVAPVAWRLLIAPRLARCSTG